MYSVVLMTALMTTTTTPGWLLRCHGCHSCYSCYAGYSGYAGYACNGCHGCYAGCYSPGYGCAGACYGYTGGCYAGFGIWNGVGDPSYLGGCTGCYGCYGGYAGYGLPVTMPANPPGAADPFPPINPNAGKFKGKSGAELVVPPEETPKTPKKSGGGEQGRSKIRIDIPAGGKLYVDGNLINTTPGSRVFTTPALTIGESYFYDIRIDVERNGAVESERRRIIIRSGEDVAVNFPNLQPSPALTAAQR